MARSPGGALEPLIAKLNRRVPLGRDEIQALENLPHRIDEVERGRYIVREGDTPGECMVVLSGFLYRSKIAGDGGRQIISVHLTGDLVCAHDHLLGEADHNIQALTRVQLAYIPQEALLSALASHAVLNKALWRDNLIDASVAREWMVNLGRRSARERVAHLICEVAMRSKAAGAFKGTSYAWPMTQEELGDATGMTSVHTNRTVQALRRDDLAEIGHGQLRIVDWDGLCVAGDFNSRYLHEEPATRLS